jgi:hypothetical protein
MRFVVLLVLIAPSLSFGDSVFSTFGPGDTFSNVGWLVDRSYNVAAAFMPSDSGALNNVRVAIGRTEIPGIPSVAMIFSLLAPGSSPTGAILENWIVAPSDVISRDRSAPPLAAIVDLESTLYPLLSAGDSYWLWAHTDFPRESLYADYEWAINVIGANGFWGSSDGGATWSPCCSPIGAIGNPTPAFQVSIVPEPASAALLLAGIVILVASTRPDSVLEKIARLCSVISGTRH